MKIKCRKCSNQFEEKGHKRVCDECLGKKRKYLRSPGYYNKFNLMLKLDGGTHYLCSIARYFQDPIYQYKREQHSEHLTGAA